MIRLEYSQIVRKKLKELRIDLAQNYGKDKSKMIMNKITKELRMLELFPESGTSVSSMFDVKCDYRFVFIEHHYFFYRTGKDTVIILEMFHEKEDFMRKLFGIITTSKETEAYWNE